jgi:hypothetical protein
LSGSDARGYRDGRRGHLSAIGADETLDDDVVGFLLAYTAGLDLGPQQRAFAPAEADVPRNASPQDQLLHRLGRQPNVIEEVR